MLKDNLNRLTKGLKKKVAIFGGKYSIKVGTMKNYLLIFTVFFFSYSSVSAQNFDVDLLKQINISNPDDDQAWLDVTNSIKWVPPAYVGANLIYGLAVNDKEAMRYSLESTISMGIGMAITGGLKKIVNRPRPTTSYPDVIHSYSPLATYNSFPSGHSTLTFAMATSASYQVGGKWYFSVPIFTYPIGVGYSRMRLGRHYPSDVLVGALIGVGSGVLGHWITNEIVR